MKRKPTKFKPEGAARQFWGKEDSNKPLDWSKAKRAVFPKLQRSAKTPTRRKG
jgi:hypothetical protein